MEIYEKIRYYREHTDLSQRNVAKVLGISRNKTTQQNAEWLEKCSIFHRKGTLN